ncbi:MAG: adenylate/guanylate cyclase domain-containing protein [Bacteroidota bacterium]
MKSWSLKSIHPKLETILWITFAWTLISILQFLIAYATLFDLDYDFASFDVSIPFKTSLLVGLLAGSIGGSGIVFLWEKWLRTKPYGWTLVSIFASFTIIYFLVSLSATLFFQSNLLELPIYDKVVWSQAFVKLLALNTLVPFIFWLLVVLLTMITLQVNDKYGPGVFKKFLLGKYFHPRREQRVFMFLDLRSSTSIAEKIGEDQYFNFLRDVFKVSTPGILKYQGEIYQYVGDEIVVSWKYRAGIENSNCVECFFKIQRLLLEKREYFLTNYGEMPEFKAGLHYGYVMAGEIGVIKRDIVFSGDVLNTTARIQGKCNELGVDILLSKALLEQMSTGNDHYQPREVGLIALRGKAQDVALCTI